jgi:formylglycine-generating enzyme required for sulfatase activity/dienelactone hydrolase
MLVLASTIGCSACTQSAAAQIVPLKTADGTPRNATYFSAGKPAPGVLLFHQSNRTRDSWNGLAQRLAEAGINVLTVDTTLKRPTPADLDAAFECLVSQPQVKRDLIGIGGAGALGVDNSVETARRHPAQVKSLALLSGETLRPQLEFLRDSPQLPGLFVYADDDEYPPTQEAMQLLYVTASSPSKKLVHYPAVEKAPWVWYEPFDIGKVPAHGGHGTDLFAPHPELPEIIVRWFAQTLVSTPGHAPADPLASADVLRQLETGGAAQVWQQLLAARRKDPAAQLFPEISASIVGQDYLRDGDASAGLEVFKLLVLAYPDSADATESLAEAHLAAGDNEQARQLAHKAIEMLDSRKAPASTWTDTEQYRGEIRKGAQKVLQQVDASLAAPGKRSGGFRDCAECPEMVSIPAGTFTMGSSDAEKAWAATHGEDMSAVADEGPQHTVSLKSFALGKYAVTQAEYAAFVHDTSHPDGDGCGKDSFKWDKQPGLSWHDPGFRQTQRDPVVCVSWHDAQAYIAWLNRKVGGTSYRMPSESEWEYAARGGKATYFWWGNDESQAAAYAWFKENAAAGTNPVGLKPANGFGLFDMAGNVWQWTEDCYADRYDRAPADGRAVEEPGNCMRVDRGSSWKYPVVLMRSATRERNPADFRDVIMGFRVAKTLP